ncbi:MAG TPA: hypothetical protein VFG79_18120, partial [Solirubrobacter sp.]|nr:hypothetical protein [Solirubrobacter sp.]
MSAAAATQRAGPWARPVTRALLPQWVARLVGLAALGSVGALEWQRLVRDLSSGRALLWVAVAVAAAAAVLVVGRRARAVALPAIVVAALFAGYALSGASLDLLKPRHWDELAAGLGTGLQALGTVRLPYAAADPWPRIVLELLGAELLILAGLLTFWPRVAPVESGRAPLAVPERGYPFLALAVLIVVVASPVVSLGGTRPLLLGLTLAALSVCFLWLERLPLRPGLGVAALLGIALAGALPLAAVADRGEPWFDYRSFAEGLGPDDPVRCSWRQSYGPIVWPRDGNEVMRVTSGEPLYWKARNLEVFDGNAWTIRTTPPDGVPVREPWAADLPDDWRNRPAWTDTVQFSIRRVSTTDVVGAGTTVRVEDASRDVQPGLSPGTWDAPSGLRRGDSYTVQVHVPRPGQQQLSQAGTGVDEAQADERLVTLPFVEGKEEHSPRGAFSQALPIPSAVMHFAPWRSSKASYAAYPSQGLSDFHVNRVMKRTAYARTWALAKRLKRGAENPMDYIRAVDAYLHRPD